jgi:hypothetical protein
MRFDVSTHCSWFCTGKIAQRLVKEGFRFWRFTRGLPRRTPEAQSVSVAASANNSSSSSSSSSSTSATNSSSSISGTSSSVKAAAADTSNSDEPELNEYDDSTVARLDSDVSNGFGTEEVADIDDKWL